MENQKPRPEIAVAMEYNKIIEELRHVSPKQDFEKCQKLITQVSEDIGEAQARFVVPNLKNDNQLNRIRGFHDWFTGWENYLNSMSPEEQKNLRECDERYYWVGSCPEYENMKLPAKYKIDFTDLTEKEWAARGEDVLPSKPDKKPLLQRLAKSLGNINTLKAKSASEMSKE